MSTGKMTFQFESSFSATVVVDREAMEKLIGDLRKVIASEDFVKLPVKNQVFAKLVVQAADRSFDEGCAELLRYNLRTGINETTQDELACRTDAYTIKVSPAKVVRVE